MRYRHKRPNRSIGRSFADSFIRLLGCALYAAAVHIFSVPNHIAQSGLTGVAIVLNSLTGFPTGTLIFLLNLPLFLAAWRYLGHALTVRSVCVTGLISLLIDLLDRLLPRFIYTGDTLLAALFSGMLGGVGLALILARGATSGGTDIIGKLVRRFFPFLSIGTVILLFDAAVIILSAIVFQRVESALYAAVVIFLSTRMIDYVLYGIDRCKLILVVTDHAVEISKVIGEEVRRGTSILPLTGGYSGEAKQLLLCAVRRSETAKILRIVKRLDGQCFIMITEAGEVLGKGFALNH